MNKIKLQEVRDEEELPNDQLKALWNVKMGHWDRAHEIAQHGEGHPDYDRIHAFLHRYEGDKFNSAWWYRKINIAYPTNSLEKEWVELVEEYTA